MKFLSFRNNRSDKSCPNHIEIFHRDSGSCNRRPLLRSHKSGHWSGKPYSRPPNLCSSTAHLLHSNRSENLLRRRCCRTIRFRANYVYKIDLQCYRCRPMCNLVCMVYSARKYLCNTYLEYLDQSWRRCRPPQILFQWASSCLKT